MIHDYKKALTKEDLYKIVFDDVCHKYGYDRKQVDTLMKKDAQFRHRVSDYLTPHLTGRPTPVKQKKLGEGEGQRCYNISLFYGCYPKRINTDDDRLRHLQKLYTTEDINKTTYLDLAKVLSVKEEAVSKVFMDDPAIMEVCFL